MDNAYQFTFLLRLLHGLQQVAETYNGVEWCTNLMGHIGQEHRLLMTRVVGTLCFTLQLFLLAHQTLNVTPNAKAARQLAVVVIFWNTVNHYPLRFLVFLTDNGMHLSDP